MTHSLNDLNPTEMIGLSNAWLGPQKTLFTSIPAIAPLLPSVELCHHSLVSARNAETLELELDDASHLAVKLDTRHDHLIRALNASLDAAFHFALAQDPADTTEAAKIEQAQEILLPEGLGAVNRSHASEAGNAVQMAEAAKGAIAPTLQGVVVRANVSALDLVNLLAQVGKELGDADRKKSELAAAQDQNTISLSEVRIRMRTWIKTVETVLAALSLSGAAQADIDALSAPIYDVAGKATARRKARWAEKKKAKEEAAPHADPKNP